MISSDVIQQRWQLLQDMLQSINPHRPLPRILVVTKGQSIETMRQCYALGLRDFAENKWQEAADKIDALADCPEICWHFIGRLQTNKLKFIAQSFHWVHTVDSLERYRKLDHVRPHNRCLNVCLQLSDDRVVALGQGQSYGWSGRALDSLLPQQVLAGLPIRGLMMMVSRNYTAEERMYLYQLGARCYEKMALRLNDCDLLNMGTSFDFDMAYQAGANCIRIGSLLFQM